MEAKPCYHSYEFRQIVYLFWEEWEEWVCFLCDATELRKPLFSLQTLN